MSCTPTASSSPHVFTCVLLALFLHATLIAPVGAATRSKSGNNVIRIWIVGDPHSGVLPEAVVPQDLLQRAEKLGYTIEMEAFRADGFAAKFRQARLDHNEPEILTFDNYGVIYGMKTVRGWVEGIDSDRQVPAASSLALVHETMTSLQKRGWVMLVRSAANYEAARVLSMRPPECQQCGPAAASPTIEPALREAEEKAVIATRAYLACDRSKLSAMSDESRLVQQCFLPQSDTKVESVKACRVSGNHKLAFVSLVTGFSAEVSDPKKIMRSRPGVDLGQRTILAVLRNQSGTWRLLAITHDPVNTVVPTRLTTNVFVNSLGQGRPTGITPVPALLLTADGVYPVPERGERFGDFFWRPSESPDVVGQVVEFMWGKDTNWGLTRLFFLPATENKVSSGYLMSGGKSVWRVWSVNSAGDISFSEQHRFNH